MNFKFWRGGDPFIWLTGSALALCLLMIAGLVSIILYNGVGVFWPKDLLQVRLQDGQVAMGHLIDRQVIPDSKEQYRIQLKVGNRDAYGLDFRWIDEAEIVQREWPEEAVVFERLEWGDAYVFIKGIYAAQERLAEGGQVGWVALQEFLDMSAERWEEIEALERDEIGKLNYEMEDLRLKRRRLELEGASPAELEELEVLNKKLWDQYELLSNRLMTMREENETVEVEVELANGETRRIKVSDIVRAYRPMSRISPARRRFICPKGGSLSPVNRASPIRRAAYFRRYLAPL